jgi:hypothetical protein
VGRKTKAPEPATPGVPAEGGLIERVKAAYTGRRDLSGSRSPAFTCILVSQLDAALWKGPDPDPEVVRVKEHATLRALQGVAPRDPVEGMLAAQMVATHDAAMECFKRAHIVGQSFEARQAELGQASKLVRAYAALAETLDRRRRPSEQVVRVERVTVESGGRAIVGNVSHLAGGRGMEEKPTNTTDQPAASDLAAWRARLAAARGRDAQQTEFSAWASAAGCVAGEGDEGHIWTPPDHLDPRLAASMQAWAILACMNLRPPGGSWAASDARLNLLPEGTSAS